MRDLFAVGERMAVEGHEWYEQPPVLLSGVDDAEAGGGGGGD